MINDFEPQRQARFAFANLRKLMNMLVAAAATMKSSTRVGFLKGFERINSIC